jgi:hypothetical protein
MTVVIKSGEYVNFIVDTFLKNNKRVFVNPKTIFTNPKGMSFGSEEEVLSLEDYKWCEPTVCRNCKSNYANREDSLTCPCLDGY